METPENKYRKINKIFERIYGSTGEKLTMDDFEQYEVFSEETLENMMEDLGIKNDTETK